MADTTMSLNSFVQDQNKVLADTSHVLVPLEPVNAYALLGAADTLSPSDHVKADQILSRLEALNPIVRKDFGPRSAALSKLQPRLLRDAIDPDGPFESFLVISYCWHSSEWALAPSASPVVPVWEISQPMIEAIMALRSGPHDGVWMDKLCIDQNDTVDKTAHIGALPVIYRSARRLLILLEDVQFTEDEETAGLSYVEFYHDMAREVEDRGLEGNAKARFVADYFPAREATFGSARTSLRENAKLFMRRLLSARWFSRAWCAHESRITPQNKHNSPLMLCFGHNGRVLSIEFRCVYYTAMYFSDDEEPVSLSGSSPDDLMNDPRPRSLRQLWWRIQRLLLLGMQDRDSAFAHARSVLTFQCLQLGDLISIALNTARVPLVFTGKLDRIEDVLCIFSILTLAMDDATPLVVAGTKVRITDSRGNDSVSWAVRPLQGELDRPIPIRSPHTIQAATEEFIALDLLVFDSLPRPPSPQALEAANIFVKQHELVTFATEDAEVADEIVKRSTTVIASEVERVAGNTHLLPSFIPTWIAYALDCGLAWATRFPDCMAADTAAGWMYGELGGASDGRLEPAAVALLNALNNGNDALETSKRQQSLAGLIKFLACIIDPRLQLFTINPRRLDLGEDRYAFVPTTSNRSYIAVPRAVAEFDVWHKRAWVIEPCEPGEACVERVQDYLVDPHRVLRGDEQAEDIHPVLHSDYADRRAARLESGSWKLRRREELFGDPLIVDHSSTQSSDKLHVLQNQRVYGSEDYDWHAILTAARAFEDLHGPGQATTT